MPWSSQMMKDGIHSGEGTSPARQRAITRPSMAAEASRRHPPPSADPCACGATPRTPNSSRRLRTANLAPKAPRMTRRRAATG